MFLFISHFSNYVTHNIYTQLSTHKNYDNPADILKNLAEYWENKFISCSKRARLLGEGRGGRGGGTGFSYIHYTVLRRVFTLFKNLMLNI